MKRGTKRAGKRGRREWWFADEVTVAEGATDVELGWALGGVKGEGMLAGSAVLLLLLLLLPAILVLSKLADIDEDATVEVLASDDGVSGEASRVNEDAVMVVAGRITGGSDTPVEDAGVGVWLEVLAMIVAVMLVAAGDVSPPYTHPVPRGMLGP